MIILSDFCGKGLMFDVILTLPQLASQDDFDYTAFDRRSSW